ncbi:MAG: type II secretion system protein [Campylobacteraceae bacterium]|jgi:hypothetical protein|nr:type II secretion system protein [Campylobacteraceae bacterium]
MRKGFGLIMAIAFIVFVATIGALALSFSTQTTKQTGDVYLKAQAELLAMSSIEYALLAISAHDIAATGNCINQITLTYGGMFNINMIMQYIGNGLPVPGCNTLAGTNAIATADSSVTVLIDTIVQSNAGVGTERITIHRRTLQKP